MGWKVIQGRIKETYHPIPNAKEKRFEAFLDEQQCIGCGRFGIEKHHVMQSMPSKRWRRDHMCQIPVCPDCHRGKQGIHGIGSEAKWCEINQIDIEQTMKMLWLAAMTEGAM